jgi:superfamily II DNA or RNA helicase
MDLRKYQIDSIQELRFGARDNRSQVLVAPTGAGKTVIATHLMSEAVAKNSTTWFVCDRVALVDQTSQMFDRYGLRHGVIQANHWRYRPRENAQVVSAQTIARRDAAQKPRVIIWDECHTLYKSVISVINKNPEAVVIGLTATPFTKGMSSVFTNVINCSTTNELIKGGWLVPLKAYVAKTIDMSGAEVKFDGEWKESEIEVRGVKIIGDIVREWESKTSLYFGGPVKTICFSASVNHGAELCRAFAAAGHNFQQISYKDGNDERRRKLIEEFRKSNSEITGLVSCEALAKGFDVSDILCGIGARPYRKSLSGHIQQIGRVMRPHYGKEFSLWLDHSGNLERFAQDQQELFDRGVKDLSSEDLDSTVRKERAEKEKRDLSCGDCGLVFSGKICPACGWTRQAGSSHVIATPGTMQEFAMSGVNRYEVWQQICWIAKDRKSDSEKARAFAQAQFKNMFGDFAKWRYDDTPPVYPTREIQKKVGDQIRNYRFRKAGYRGRA